MVLRSTPYGSKQIETDIPVRRSPEILFTLYKPPTSSTTPCSILPCLALLFSEEPSLALLALICAALRCSALLCFALRSTLLTGKHLRFCLFHPAHSLEYRRQLLPYEETYISHDLPLILHSIIISRLINHLDIHWASSQAPAQHVFTPSGWRRTLPNLTALSACSPSIRYTSHRTSCKPLPCLPAYGTALFPRVDIPQHVHPVEQGAKWRKGRERDGRRGGHGGESLSEAWSSFREPSRCVPVGYPVRRLWTKY